MLKKHIPLKPLKQVSPWRKISLGSWRPTGDSSIHTMLELDARPMIEYLKKNNENNPAKISEVHFSGLVMGKVIEQYPNINRIVRFGKIYQRENIDIFFHVALDKKTGEDLTGLVIRKINKSNIKEVASTFKEKLTKIIKTNDADFKQIKGLFGLLPGFLSRPLLDLTSVLFYNLNIWSPILGAPRDPFGSIQITSIGSLGVDSAFVPIAPYTRIPMVLAVGTIEKRPFVIEDKVEAIETIKLCFTFDHRLMEGVHFSKMQELIKKYFENPDELE